MCSLSLASLAKPTRCGHLQNEHHGLWSTCAFHKATGGGVDALRMHSMEAARACSIEVWVLFMLAHLALFTF